MADSQLDKLMKNLGLTEAEAREVLEADRAIDKGDKMDFDLTPEQNKVAQSFVKVTDRKKPTVYDLDARKHKRKENPTKADIIKAISEFLPQMDEVLCENVQITNKERMISFSVGENKFELTLIQKRKPKS